MKKTLLNVLVIVLIVLFAANMVIAKDITISEKSTPTFIIAVSEDGSVNDVILSTDIATKIKAENYKVPTGIARLFNEVNALQLDDEVVIAIYNGKSRIIFKEGVAEMYNEFNYDMRKILKDNKIEYSIINSDKVTSEDLLSLFEEKKEEPLNSTTECIGESCPSTKQCASDFNCNDNNPCTKDLCEGTVIKKCIYTQKEQMCNYNNTCIPVGTVLEDFYCATSTTLENKKADGTSCNNNYECYSSNCRNSECIPDCSGCLTEDNTCESTGARTNTTYCDISGNFITLKEKNSECSNNYECTQGICKNNKCKDKSVFTKFMEWFKIF